MKDSFIRNACNVYEHSKVSESDFKSYCLEVGSPSSDPDFDCGFEVPLVNTDSFFHQTSSLFSFFVRACLATIDELQIFICPIRSNLFFFLFKEAFLLSRNIFLIFLFKVHSGVEMYKTI